MVCVCFCGVRQIYVRYSVSDEVVSSFWINRDFSCLVKHVFRTSVSRDILSLETRNQIFRMRIVYVTGNVETRKKATQCKYLSIYNVERKNTFIVFKPDEIN